MDSAMDGARPILDHAGEDGEIPRPDCQNDWAGQSPTPVR